jgi:two-component system NarL family sensor kinase
LGAFSSKGQWWLCLLVAFNVQADPQPEDTARVGWLYRSARGKISTEPAKAKQLSTQALELSRSKGYHKGEALALSLIGMQLRERYQFDSAQTHFEKAIALLKDQPGSESEIREIRILQGLTLSDRGQPKQALDLLLRLIDGKENDADQEPLAPVYRTIGEVYCHLNESERAIKYLNKALQASRQNTGSLNPEYGKSLYTLGRAYSQITALDSTYRIISKGASFDSALSIFRKVLPIARQLNDQALEANALNALGTMYMRQGKYKETLQELLPALAVFRKLGKTTHVGTVLSNLGTCYYSLGRFIEAESNYKEALAIGNKTKNLELIKEVEGNLYWLYKDAQNHAQALRHLENFSIVNDSLFSQTRSRQIEELEAKYETDKRARKLELAEAKMAQRTTERNGLIAIVGILLAAGALLIRSFRQRQRATAQLSLKNEELNQQRIRDLKWEQKLATIKASLDGQERERMRIGQDLHDRLGSMLSAVKLYFYLSPETRAILPPSQLARHELANKLLDDSCQEVRRIAHDMVSNVLIRFGLVTALEELVQTINESNQLRMKLSCHHLNHRLDSKVEVTVYRIIQELVGNALKHSQATKLDVSLFNRDDKMLHLIFQDNGIGFDYNKLTNGMGIQNVQARAAQLGGTLEFDTAPEHGAVITLDIPLPENPVYQPSAEPLNEPEFTESVADVKNEG